MTWVQIVSWHVVDRVFRASVEGREVGDGRTLCGRTFVERWLSDDLPAGKSCENCLRVIARRGR